MVSCLLTVERTRAHQYNRGMGVGGIGSSIAQLLEQLDAAIAGISNAVDSECVDLPSASVLAGAMERSMRRLDSVVIDVADQVDRHGLFALDGHGSALGWLAFNNRTSRADAQRRMRCAKAFRQLADTAATYRDGAIGREQVAGIARLHGHERVGDQVAEFEELFLAEAQRLNDGEFAKLLGHWKQLADVDGAEQSFETAHQNRTFSLLKLLNGGWSTNGRLGQLDGDELEEALRQIMAADREANGVDSRSAGQRRADAFMILIRQGLATEPGAQPPEPVVNIVADPTTLSDALTGQVTPLTPETFTSRRCQTVNGTPIPPSVALQAALAGTFRRIILGPGEASVSRRSRLFTGPLRKLLEVRDQTCTHPGCDMPATRCQGDHTIAWRHTRNTSITNGGLRCGKHNRFKEHGFHVWRDPAGTWHTIRPDGTEITPAA